MQTPHYETEGAGPPVLLIQGTGVAGCGWQPQVRGLRDTHELCWFDNRGIGGTPGPPGNIEAMARDALAVLDALGWETASIVGHSLGGVIAQQVAVLAPERVDRLGLLCTFARGRAAISLRPSAVWLNLRTMVGTYAMRRRAFYDLVTDPALPANEDNLTLLERAFGRGLADLPPAATAQVMALARADLREDLARLDAIPTLVMSATSDRLAAPTEGRELARVLQTEFLEIPGGHAVPVQDPERVNTELRRFLQS